MNVINILLRVIFYISFFALMKREFSLVSESLPTEKLYRFVSVVHFGDEAHASIYSHHHVNHTHYQHYTNRKNEFCISSLCWWSITKPKDYAPPSNPTYNITPPFMLDLKQRDKVVPTIHFFGFRRTILGVLLSHLVQLYFYIASTLFTMCEEFFTIFKECR